MRDVLVHYHLFKNAGSSIDRGLRSSFGDRWHAFDPEKGSSIYCADELDGIIASRPDVLAFSSHCIVPPFRAASARIHPIVMLREPIARVASAWRFEWQKQKGLERPSGSLAEYVTAKFELPRCSAIEEFQTMRLAVCEPNLRRPRRDLSDEQILGDACAQLDELPMFGLVERFDESATAFERTYGETFPGLTFDRQAVNVTQSLDTSLEERHERIRKAIGSELFEELLVRNALDSRFYAHAKQRFEHLLQASAEEFDAMAWPKSA